jgi:hypothetical protein
VVLAKVREMVLPEIERRRSSVHMRRNDLRGAR